MNTSLRHSLTRNGFRALNRVVIPAAKKGVGSPPWLGFGVVVMETIGRRSGEPRQVPLLSARMGNTVVMSTVRNPSQWVENAAASGSARVWVGGSDRAGTASVRRGLLQVVRVDLDEDPDLTPALAS